MTASGPEWAKSGRSLGVLYIVAGVAVFIGCSIVQGIGHSSMFSTTYPQPSSGVLDLLMNVTFWPGWLVSVGLVFRGAVTMLDK